jgi:hypothetical protein
MFPRRFFSLLLLATGFFLALPKSICAQITIDLRDKNQDTTDRRTFTVNAEFRPRAEFRDGYRTLREDSSIAAFYVSQRSRVQMRYDTRKFAWVFSMQDIRVWGEDDPRSTDGSIQVYETYFEPTIAKNLSLRIGRQKIVYDNQRLFAENDWRQNANAHDALRIMYRKPKLNTELTLAFNQLRENIFNTDFSPATYSNYKFLGVHYFNYTFNKNWNFLTINAADGFQDTKNKEKLQMRYTSGGRLEYFHTDWYATMSAYYQYGKNPKGAEMAGYYLQPELKYTGIKNLTLRLGAEYISGQDAKDSTNKKDNSFVPLYGVAHRFMGYMDYFTAFPADLNNAGLVNPYLFVIFDLNKKFQIRNDLHLFYSQNNFISNGQVIDKYLAFEHDILLSWMPNKATKLEFGFSYMSPTNSMEAIKKGGNSELTPIWSYMMLTVKPELLKILF